MGFGLKAIEDIDNEVNIIKMKTGLGIISGNIID